MFVRCRKKNTSVNVCFTLNKWIGKFFKGNKIIDIIIKCYYIFCRKCLLHWFSFYLHAHLIVGMVYPSLLSLIACVPRAKYLTHRALNQCVLRIIISQLSCADDQFTLTNASCLAHWSHRPPICKKKYYVDKFIVD